MCANSWLYGASLPVLILACWIAAASLQSKIGTVSLNDGAVSAINHGLLTQTFFNKVNFTAGETRTMSIKNDYGSDRKFAQITLVMSGNVLFGDVRLMPVRIGYYLGYYEIMVKNVGADAGPAYFAINIQIQ